MRSRGMQAIHQAMSDLQHATHLLEIRDQHVEDMLRSYNLLDAETSKTKRKLAKVERELTKYRKKAAIKAYKRKNKPYYIRWSKSANVVGLYGLCLLDGMSKKEAYLYVKSRRFE